MCSTPFGITDYIGCHPALDVRRAPGAQRLSASRIISAAVLRDLPSRALTCSTPFGITDYIGPWRLCCPWRALRVLNAFRHHGLYRSTATRMVRSPNVLNAFRHHGLYRWEAVTGRYARLRCSTPFGITDYIGRRPTWRRRCCGCRAQRLSASRIISVVLPLDVCRRQPCSTPFGITDYIGRRWCRSGRGAWSPGAQRLSASRIISAVRGLPGLAYFGCSTPFGITDYIGVAVAEAAPSVVDCAQRLSASRIISAPSAADRSTPRPRVLNAFRHHGLYRLPVRAVAPRSGSSAQRLSASRIISVGDRSAGAGARQCSTPFGITDYIGRAATAWRSARWSAQRLSASRIISAAADTADSW